MSDHAVIIENLFLKYEDKNVLNDLSLTVRKGEIHALAGPEGSGKTTFLNALAGIIPISAGTAKIFGERAGSLESRKKIGYVPAELAFYPGMTVVDYLVYMGMLSGVSHLEAISRAIALLKKIDLNSFRDKRPVDLPIGMKTKIAIIQGLMSKPALLLLDEPVGRLELLGKQSTLQIIEELSRSEKITTIISSNNWLDVQSIADKITLLHQGRALISEKTTAIRELYSYGNFLLETSDNSGLFDILKKIKYLQQLIRTERDSIIVITKETERFRKDLPGIIYKLEIELLKFEQQELNMETISRCLSESEGE